jgi:glycosyltransferase involved in cell wall biosynthesis
MATPLISVIITTYNWPEALNAVLCSLEQQTTLPFEILIADDGSGPATRQIINDFQSRLTIPLHHIWHPDEGFRAAAIRNKATLAAKGNYIIFLDGDCIPRPNFIKAHMQLAEPGYFVAGNRVLLSQKFTSSVLTNQLPIHRWSFMRWSLMRFKQHCNRILPFISLPLGLLRKLNPSQWIGAKGCNLAIWKQDLIEVNGWEEGFSGWGYEDSDLIIRLIRLGIKRKNGKQSVPVIHLWHPDNSRNRERHNWDLFQSRQTIGILRSEKGLC